MIKVKQRGKWSSKRDPITYNLLKCASDLNNSQAPTMRKPSVKFIEWKCKPWEDHHKWKLGLFKAEQSWKIIAVTFRHTYWSVKGCGKHVKYSLTFSYRFSTCVL